MRITVGLDIGTQSVRACVTRCGKKRIRVLSCHERVLPPRENADTWLDDLAPALEGLRREVGHRSSKLVISLPANMALIRALSVPFTRGVDVARTLPAQIEPRIPYAAEDVLVVYEAVAEEEGKTSVLAAAIPKEPFRTLWDLVNSAGFEPDAVTLDIFALSQLLKLRGAGFDYRTALVLDLGAGGTKAILLDDGRLIGARAFRLGGAVLTRAIQAELGISFDAAETMKKEAHSLSEIKSDRLKATIRAHYERLARETVLFLQSLGTERKVELVVLAGGGRIEGIEDIFKAATSAEIESIDISRFASFPAGQAFTALSPPGSFAVAIGACAARQHVQTPGHNLLQQEFKPRTRVETLVRPLTWTLALLAILMGLWAYRYSSSARAYKIALDTIQKAGLDICKDVFGPNARLTAGTLAKMRAKVEELQARVDTLSNGPQRRSAFLRLTEILARVPKETRFTVLGLSIYPERANLTAEVDSLADANRVKNALDQSEMLNCRLSRSRAQGGKWQVRLELEFPEGGSNHGTK